MHFNGDNDDLLRRWHFLAAADDCTQCSCDGGNLELVVVRACGALIPHIALFAHRDIAAEEELTFSYGPPSAGQPRALFWFATEDASAPAWPDRDAFRSLTQPGWSAGADVDTLPPPPPAPRPAPPRPAPPRPIPIPCNTHQGSPKGQPWTLPL